MTNKALVAKQYKNADKLTLRQSLHEELDKKYYDTMKNYFESKKVNRFLRVPKEYEMFASVK